MAARSRTSIDSLEELAITRSPVFAQS